MSDFDARAREIVESEQGMFLPIGEIDTLISAISSALKEAVEDKDARISSLEQTVAKAFLALGEVAEALEPLTCRSTPEHEADDAECEIDVTTGDLRKAKAVRERIMDLCHADASRADSPHRADGALQTSSEKDA